MIKRRPLISEETTIRNLMFAICVHPYESVAKLILKGCFILRKKRLEFPRFPLCTLWFNFISI